jgi:hypothetical protein
MSLQSLIPAACLAGLIAAPGFATITPDELWAQWQQSAKDAGLSLTAASEVRADGELRLTELELTSAEDAASDRLTLPALILTETADGGVQARPEGEMRLALVGGKVAGLLVSQSALVMTVTESDAGLSHQLKADRLTIAGADATATAAPTRGGEVNVTFTGLDLKVTDTEGPSRVFGLDLLADKLAYDISGTDPIAGSETLSSAEVDDLFVAGDLALAETRSILAVKSPRDFADLLRDGFALRLESRTGEQRGTEKDSDPLMPVEVVYTGLPGTTDLVVNAQTISGSVTGEGLAAVVTSPGFIGGTSEIAVGPIAFEIALPGPANQDVGDWTFVLKMADVVLGDGLWNSFDPEGVLNREPLALALDLGWRMKWDMFAAMEADFQGKEAEEPIPESMTLRDFSFAGAGLAGKAAGAFRFSLPPGAGVESIIPEGTGTLEVTGVNALIEAMIMLGQMTRDDAMGARMAMSAFLKPDGEDRFTSELEARADGQIFVNGARMK